MQNSAKEYEVAFNGIKASIEKGDITQVGGLCRLYYHMKNFCNLIGLE